ncbi:GNAT family N-acetyltransferase [Paucibacter soli]|uniref:GNAT family N-acetyltransferase n=1 Tax=Paucibacter soli TaxID=3133433 RepID=UPI0030B6D207
MREPPLITARLRIRRMCLADAGFMLALLNEPTWLHFIGDRGVRTLEDARNYILQGPVAMVARLGYGFGVVESLASGEPLGICGLAKRDYLEHADLGFAFMPQHGGQGYAHEAAAAVLACARGELGMARVLATTRSYNHGSQKLLEKLGLRFERMIRHPDGDRELMLYAVGDS